MLTPENKDSRLLKTNFILCRVCIQVAVSLALYIKLNYSCFTTTAAPLIQRQNLPVAAYLLSPCCAAQLVSISFLVTLPLLAGLPAGGGNGFQSAETGYCADALRRKTALVERLLIPEPCVHSAPRVSGALCSFGEVASTPSVWLLQIMETKLEPVDGDGSDGDCLCFAFQCSWTSDGVCWGFSAKRKKKNKPGPLSLSLCECCICCSSCLTADVDVKTA